MTDDSIEAKALALVNEVLIEWGLEPRCPSIEQLGYAKTTALCRAIERHEAFNQDVSDAVQEYIECFSPPSWHRLNRFITPKPKPDPLEEVLTEIDHAAMWVDKCAEEIRASLGARGWEIREKGV